MKRQMYEERLRAQEILRQLTGEPESRLSDTALRLSLEALGGRLREDLSEETLGEYRELLAYTAALKAMEQLLAAENARAPAELRAGELSVKNGGGAEGLRALIESCMEELAPVLRDRAFVFREMEDEEEP